MMKTKPQEGGVVWLYNEGEVSPLIGGWNTTGYKYGSDANFAQSIEADCLYIYATSAYNNKGGRTYTSNLILPTSVIGKTLHVTGDMTNTAGFMGGRSYAYAFVSESVADGAESEWPTQSGAFTNSIRNYWYSGDIAANTTKQFEITLSLTQSGYLSVVLFKNYNGTQQTKFRKIWIE